MAKDYLKQKATSGMVWAVVQKYSTMAIGFISGNILARLLMPKEYCAIGILAFFIGLVEELIDLGFGSALL